MIGAFVMAKNNYLFYSDYLKTRNTENKSIMIAKTKKSYLIGPIIDHNFYKDSFWKIFSVSRMSSPKGIMALNKATCRYEYKSSTSICLIAINP